MDRTHATELHKARESQAQKYDFEATSDFCDFGYRLVGAANENDSAAPASERDLKIES